MTFDAQKLRTPIELQAFTTPRNEFGEEIETWATYATPLAKVEPMVGREYLAAGAEVGETKLKVTIRYRSDVSRLHRLILQGDAFEIVDAQNIKFRNRELLLYCRRIE